VKDKFIVTEHCKPKEPNEDVRTMKWESEALRDGRQKKTQILSHLCATHLINTKKELMTNHPSFIFIVHIECLVYWVTDPLH